VTRLIIDSNQAHYVKVGDS